MRRNPRGPPKSKRRKKELKATPVRPTAAVSGGVVSTDLVTADDWDAKADLKIASARHAINGPDRGAALEAAALALECALKAAIIRNERLNAWPSRSSRPDLYSHKHLDLLTKADLWSEWQQAQQSGDPIVGDFLEFRDGLEMRYRHVVTSRRRLRDIVDAAEGLVRWVRQKTI